jgi:hypothetical protein
MCEDFAANFGCCMTTTHHLTLPFSPGNFLAKIKLMSAPTWPPVYHHFDTIEAESQAVLNSLKEHDFQGAFKNIRSAGNGAYALKGTSSRVMVASRPKFSF